MTYFKKTPNIYRLWQQHQAAHWMSSELCFDRYTEEFKTIPQPLQDVFFRALAVFTVLDVEVAHNYDEEKDFYGKYPDIFAFATDRIARESTHIDAYSQILTLVNQEHLIGEAQKVLDKIKNPNPFKQPIDVVAYQTLYGILVEGGLLYALFFLVNDLCEKDPAINRFSIANQWSFRDEFLHYSFARNLLEMTRAQYTHIYSDVSLIDRLLDYILGIFTELEFYIMPYEDIKLNEPSLSKALTHLMELRKSEITGNHHTLFVEELEYLNKLISNFQIDRMQNQFEIISDQYTK